MDQIKIGAFLKTLRKEKNLTQEQAAEQLGVSNRTVSRWETGTNMPDISLLLEIAELYGVSIPELIDGERKSEKMNEEAKEVASRMSDYAETEKTTILKNVRSESLLGVCALAVVMVFFHASGLLYKFKRGDRESSLPKPFLCLIALAAAAAVAFGIWFLVSLIGGQTPGRQMFMYKICKDCGEKCDLSEKKCPVCGGKLKKQFTEEELKEIQKQNDDMTVINILLM